jgi:hypothetical protein
MDSLSLDPALLASLQGPGKDQIEVKKFSLPHHLGIRDLTSFWKLQVYIEAISSKKHRQEDPLFPPKEFLSLGEIENKAPDLVHRNYVVEYTEIDRKKAASQIGIKETWHWQLGEEGWNWLQKKYASLAKSSAVTKEDRFAVLETLDEKQRTEIDRASREEILLQNPAKIKELLGASEKKTVSIAVTKSGKDLPFTGLTNPASFASLLEEARIQEKIEMYTQDEQHYYSFCIVEKAPFRAVKTFSEANSSGVLRRMFDKKLEQAYPEIRRKDSLTYMKKDGSWKPLSEVSDKVAKAVFTPALKAIALQYKALHGNDPSKEEMESFSFYPEQWMALFLQNYRADSQLLLQKHTEDSLASQWDLVQEEEILERGKYGALAAIPFIEGSVSPVLSLASGKPCFFYIVKNLPPAEVTASEMEMLKAPLKKIEEKKLFDQLFAEIESKNALSLQGTL